MSISPAVCSIFKKQGLTVVELTVVAIIIAVVTGMGVAAWQAQIEKEYADNAKVVLQSAWQAEQAYFAWKNVYTDDWSILDIEDPNNKDKFYAYDIPLATVSVLNITATRRGKSNGFTITQDGTITAF